MSIIAISHSFSQQIVIHKLSLLFHIILTIVTTIEGKFNEELQAGKEKYNAT
jgi:hypothetical protein